MSQELRKIRSFTDLKVWQIGHSFVLDIYRITRGFPFEELLALTSQLRRASISFTSNIAEGFSRHSYKEKVRFYSMALGSLTEAQNQLLIAKDIGYLLPEQFQELAKKTIEASKMINGLIKKSKSLILTS